MKRKRHSLRATAAHLLPLLALTSSATYNAPADSIFQAPLVLPQPVEQAPVQRQTFRLRHVFHHGTHRYPGLLRKVDVSSPSTPCLSQDSGPCLAAASSGLDIASTPINIQRLHQRSPAEMGSLMAAGRDRGAPIDLPFSAWTVDQVQAPNVTDKPTVLSLARMTSDAYVEEPGTTNWVDVGGGFNHSIGFGWESDGLRGHIFADDSNSTVVLAIKGTTPAVFDGADTTTNDKVNDNLLFSCCCGQGGNILWRQVCDCKTATYTCNSTCVIQSLRQEDKYYAAAVHLYNNVTALYPHSEFWLAGHSLGGAISSLLGLTFGRPAVTFEAPGEAMAARRLGLPKPPVDYMHKDVSTGAFHFGHTGDPVYLGTCSTCSMGAYAMESQCHTGNECIYDTVKDLGFHNYIGNHKIVAVIRDVLEVYDKPAKCKPNDECIDCINWEFFKSNSSSTTTTSKSSPTSSFSQTRTETCKTPGWFGCLDDTTTSGPTHSKTTQKSTSTSTSTCKTPGWFGCLDETTTTSKSSTSSMATTTTTTTTTATTITTETCKTPGWFGCLDPTTTSPSQKPTTSTSTSTCKTPGWFGCLDPTTSKSKKTTSSTTTTCHTPGWFGCNDPVTTTTETATTTTTSTTTTTCKTPGFFWGCKDRTADAVWMTEARRLAPKATPALIVTAATPSPTAYR